MINYTPDRNRRALTDVILTSSSVVHNSHSHGDRWDIPKGNFYFSRKKDRDVDNVTSTSYQRCFSVKQVTTNKLHAEVKALCCSLLEQVTTI